MLPRQSACPEPRRALRSHLNSLYSAFAQAAPLTPLSSAFTKTPGGRTPSNPSGFPRGPRFHAFPPNFQTFQRSTCKRNSCFQSLPHSFSCRARVFNNLHTLYNVKFRLTLTESIIPALFRKKDGYGYPGPNSVIPTGARCVSDSVIPREARNLFFCAGERSTFSRTMPIRAIRCTIRAFRCKKDVFPCNTLSPRAGNFNSFTTFGCSDFRRSRQDSA